MLHWLPRFGKSQNYKLVLSLAIGGALLVAPAALAIKYKKPPHPTAPRGASTGGGVRGGCDGTDPIGLTALAPLGEHVGQTTSTRPTLTWFTPNPALPTKVMLYRLGDVSETPIATPVLMANPNVPGMMQVQLPQELALNQIYSWRVIVDCPAGSKLVAKAQIIVVKPTPDVETALGQLKGLSKAEGYADAGFWYDTLAEALSLSPPAAAQDTVRSLLGNLVEMENATLQDLEKQPVNCAVTRLEETCQKQRALRRHLANLNALLNRK